MKKYFFSLLAVGLLLASCNFGNGDLPEPTPVPTPEPEGPVATTISVSELENTAWFYNNDELQFPKTGETIYIKYMPDSLTVTKWISLSESNGTVTAKIEWSEDVREIGKTSKITFTKTNEKLNVQCDFFDFSNMSSYEGVTASNFNSDQVPALKAEYLSNFSGKYTLDKSGYELSVSAKLSISASVSSYWNANVLNATVLEDGTYDLLLAHSSSKDASGSIDPGITGTEPFVTQQGLFWSHLTLTPQPGSVWQIKWLSDWKNSPYEAISADMDQSDTFTGPATTKITYKYTFYFGTPDKDEAGWCCVNKGDKINEATYESDLPTTETWKQILARAGEVKIPEGKMVDYWWYSTNAITSKEESYVWKLYDAAEPSLTEYEFYCALKDKPNSADVYYQEGTFATTASPSQSITLTKSELTYFDGTASASYIYVQGAVWSTAKDGVSPLNYAYLLSDGEKTYIALVMYYTNNGQNYIKIRPPKEYLIEGKNATELPEVNTWGVMNSMIKNSFVSASE